MLRVKFSNLLIPSSIGYVPSARQIVEKAMTIAGHICIYTNLNIIYEELG